MLGLDLYSAVVGASMSRHEASWSAAQNFVSGSLSGIAQVSVGHPLDTIKVVNACISHVEA